MPLESVERNPQNLENQGGRMPDMDKYHNIELGDLDPFASKNNSQQLKSSQQQSQKKQPDVYELIKKMIETGFTPTKNQISNYSLGAGGFDPNSTNTWFRIFLSRLLARNRGK
jgi:hypothetical protein